ncbi:DUF397 domain-containing protein [Streptomyces sp. NPDC088246]|uniref:DUF397 domain-containing protein n=1 Tax=Streptomyces sp. NPDC088246 TaxID=3365842 RepID=UPI003817DD37
MTDVPASSSSWRKSSYCAQGNSCVHIAAPAPGTVRLTETDDPSNVVTTTQAKSDAWSIAT